MFDNLGTALVQGIGFFVVFGFFVYQLLSDGKKPIKIQLKSPKKKVTLIKGKDEQTRKRGLFGNKNETVKEEVKPKKKGLFGRRVEPIENLEIPKKKGWFK